MRRALGLFIALAVIAPVVPAVAADAKPLAGKVVVIDPGHQRGNSNPKYRSQINAKKFNGSIRKACNTTGTATNAGYPESTFTWNVAKRLKRMLEAQGATVVLTRNSDDYGKFGPCTWNRAKIANEANADAFVSIHADGAAAKERGFHVIAPVQIKGWTNDIAKDSRGLAKAMIAGMSSAGATKSTYIDGALSIRSDQSTLNFSDVPAVIVEVGNMRNAKEARLFSSKAGQQQVATWLKAGLDRFLADS